MSRRKAASQFEQRNLKVQGARGATIDATIIPGAAKPRPHFKGDGQQAKIVDSAERDARWRRKGKPVFFGYRGHTAVESDDGYVAHVQVHPANEAEINRRPENVAALPTEIKAVLADKGYASKPNRQCLAGRGIGDLIQHCGSAGKRLHPLLKAFNQKISSIRFKV